MINNAFEWESLVHLNPTNEMITTRTAIVSAILSAFDSEKDVANAMRLVSAAMTGLNPSIQADIDYGATLTEVTRQHHQAISSKLSENALDFQLSACLAVGEILSRNPTKATWKAPLNLVAQLTMSANRLRPTAAGAHLKTAQDSIVEKATEVLTRSATAVRTRPEYDSRPFDEFSPPEDIQSFWSQLKPLLQKEFESIAQSSSIDRDELEVLWWLYNDYSETFSKTLSEMTPFDTALASSLELVDRALCPPPATLKNIIKGLIARVSQKPKPTAKSLKTVICAWPPEIIAALSPEDDGVSESAQTFPKVLPLTWIAIRVAQSGVVVGWEQEFEAKTGLSTGHKLTPEALAEQVFAERTAHRLLLPFCGE